MGAPPGPRLSLGPPQSFLCYVWDSSPGWSCFRAHWPFCTVSEWRVSLGMGWDGDLVLCTAPESADTSCELGDLIKPAGGAVYSPRPKPLCVGRMGPLRSPEAFVSSDF